MLRRPSLVYSPLSHPFLSSSIRFYYLKKIILISLRGECATLLAVNDVFALAIDTYIVAVIHSVPDASWEQTAKSEKYKEK